ncbi:unnamed protein product [Musa hybrid cultivar]
MALEGAKFFKLEESPGEGLITYRRRKRAMPDADALQVLDTSHRNRDIGWNHGEIVDGNRFHWMCNWCGLIRYGGGVSRLKKHLAGACHVKKCPNVPDDIAKSIMHHLMEKQKNRAKRSIRCSGIDGTELNNSHNNAIDHRDRAKSSMEMQVACAGRFSKKSTNRSKNIKIGTQFSNSASQHSKTTAQLPRTGMTKGMMEPCETVSYAGTSRPEWHDRIIRHWKNVIEHQFKLSYMKPGHGIWNVLYDALSLGHSQLLRKLMMIGAIRNHEQLNGRYLVDSEVKIQGQWPDCFETAKEQKLVELRASYYKEDTNTRKCEKAFLEILISEKFAILCDFLWDTFEENKAKTFLDFRLIDSKLKNGDYERSLELYNQDVQQIWDNMQKIGQEMIILANSLSSLSRASCRKQVIEDLINAADDPKPEEACQIGVVQTNTAGSYPAKQLTCCGSDCSTKPGQTEAADVYKAFTCKQCGMKANEECSLFCDGCEAVYHFSCIKPAIEEISTPSWFCAACSKNNKDSADQACAETTKGSLHQNCVVCDRLEVSESLEDLDENGSRTRLATDSGESSVSSMESEEPPEPSRTAVSSLCKICGTCEDEDKKFLVCGHLQCPYKFYHIRCLKSSQIASPQQQNRPCWYCPSCLCRACLCDKDDDKIVLCDGCDEAYHTYCMKPPRTLVPKGQWYCVPCNVARAREGMRRYEQWILQQHGKNEGRQSNEAIGSMDLLLSAAEKLSSEEKLASGQ